MIKVDIFTKKYTITFRSYLYLFIVLTLATSLVFSRFFTNYINTLRIAIFSLAVSFVSILILYILHKIFLKSIFNLLSAFLVAIILGISRGLMIFYLMPLIGFTSEVSLVYRIFNSTLNTVVWLIIFVLVDTLKLEFQKRYEGMISQALIKQISNLSDQELNFELEQVQNSLKKLNLNQTKNLLDSQIFISAAEMVKQQIEEAIRPLSHRLWINNKRVMPKVNALSVAKETLRTLDYNPKSVALIYSITTFINLNANLSVAGALLTTSVTTLTFYILHKTLLSIRKSRKATYLINTLYLISTSVLSYFANTLISTAYIADWPAYVTILSLLILPTYIIIFSVLRLLEQDRKSLTKLIENRINTDNTKSFETAQVASYLHNTLQSELLNASRALEISALDPTSIESRRNLERLGSLINRSISEDFKVSYMNPMQKIEEIINGWRGIVEIAFEVPEEILVKNNQSILISQIIQEAASNLIKHSNAKNLLIKARELSTGNTEISITSEKLNKAIPLNDLSNGWLASISLTRPKLIETENSQTLIIEI